MKNSFGLIGRAIWSLMIHTGCHSSRRALFIGGIVFIFMTQSLMANGTIKGRVFDKNTKEALPAANVMIKGTNIGAAADRNGAYYIPNAPTGKQTIVVSYIGYKTLSVVVTVPEGGTVQQDFGLQAVAVRGETVVVTAQARGQIEAINRQLTSNTIVNVVSSEKIHQLPDDNAATALSRLPGVSLMNGDRVVIRGVQAKLNQILLNDIELPSTDMKTRATDLGFISSNLLSGIEVIKALTPDMDANTVGGVVNLRLREAPSGLHYDALAQGNYNSTDHVGDNYKFWASVSSRFLNDKLGVFIQGNMDRSDGGNQYASISPSIDGSGSLVYGQATYHTTSARFEYDQDIVKTSGGSLIMDYKLPNGKIIFQNTYTGNFTDQRNNMILLDFNNTQVNYSIDRNLYGKDLLINALQAENTFGNIKVDLSLSHSATQQYTRWAYQPPLYGADWNAFRNGSDKSAPFGYDASGQRITYNSATAQRALLLYNVFGVFNNLNPADADSATLEGWVSSVANQFSQHLYNSSINVTAPVNFSTDITATFKVGGKYVRTTRVNNFDRYFSGSADEDTYANVLNYFPGHPNSAYNRLRLSQVMNTDFTRGKYFLSNEYNFTNGGFKDVISTNKFDNWLKASESGWSPAMKHDDSWKDDWNGVEQFAAAYLMGTFNIGPRLTALGGLRYESYNMQYHANFTFVIHSVYGDAISTKVGTITDSPNPDSLYHNVPYNAFNVNRTDVNYFPNLQLKYKFNDWSDLRVAYTTGIARPDYSAILPKVAVYPGSNYEVGNPLLKPAKAQNVDVVASFHSNAIGLFTIDAFYKEIKDVMYNTQIYYGNINRYSGNVFIPDSTFLMNRFGYVTRAQDIVNTSLNNPNTGFIRGVEIDWQTNFWYLPEPFNSLVLDINYTKSGSNMAYRIIQNKPVQIVNPVTHRARTVFQTTDTVYVGRLVQQANDVANVVLGVDYKGFSGRISFNMIGNVLNSVGIRPEESLYTGNIYRWDFTVKQNLPIDGLSIALNGVNIFHNGVKTYRNYRVNPDAPITKNLISVLYAPTVFQANLRYSF